LFMQSVTFRKQLGFMFQMFSELCNKYSIKLNKISRM